MRGKVGWKRRDWDKAPKNHKGERRDRQDWKKQAKELTRIG